LALNTRFAAIGITAEGHKRVLDFELGSSEIAEVAKDLLRRLNKRGFHCDRPLTAARRCDQR
jgi:transposase-like protein